MALASALVLGAAQIAGAAPQDGSSEKTAPQAGQDAESVEAPAAQDPAVDPGAPPAAAERGSEPEGRKSKLKPYTVPTQESISDEPPANLSPEKKSQWRARAKRTKARKAAIERREAERVTALRAGNPELPTEMPNPNPGPAPKPAPTTVSKTLKVNPKNDPAIDFHGKRLASGKRPLENRTLRIMNEVPGIAAALIVVLVIVRPF
jgi:hypothetical protein